MSARLAIASTLALLLAGCPASETPDAGADVASPDAPAPDAPAAPDAPSGLDAPSGSDAPTAADAPVPSDVPSASDAAGLDATGIEPTWPRANGLSAASADIPARSLSFAMRW